MALSLVSTVLLTLVVVLFSIIAFKLTLAWRHISKLGKAVDQLPGEPKHWLWGTLNQVRQTLDEADGFTIVFAHTCGLVMKHV